MSDNESDAQCPVEVPEHLKCPISLTLLEDPITIPCCGRAFSRTSLQVEIGKRKICPVCFTNLPTFDPNTAPKAVTVQGTIDAFIEEHDGNIEDFVPDKSKIEKPIWHIDLIRVPNTGVSLREIAQLRITNENKKFSFKTLLITVVDESGSMGGNPITQVKFSLDRIVDSAYANQNVVCHVVGYDTSAQSFFIDVAQTKDVNYAKVAKIGRGGGTSFSCAFDEIIRIIENMRYSPVNNLNDISDLVIVFMTDGQDCTVGNERMKMVAKLSESIKKVWIKPFTVHTIGFSQGHDMTFLQALANAGTLKGAYRFADPSEDNDSLSVKIASIVRSVMGGASAPVELHPYRGSGKIVDGVENLDFKSLPIMGGDNGCFWIDVTDAVRASPEERTRTQFLYTIKLNGYADQVIDLSNIFADLDDDDEKTEIIGVVKDKSPEQIKNVEYAWYSFQMDRIASELYELNSETSILPKDGSVPLSRQIHLELLNSRTKALSLRVSADTPEFTRLTGLIETLNTLRKGVSVDKMKLADQISEGRFKTESTQKTVSTNQQASVQQYTPSNYVVRSTVFASLWETHDISAMRRVMKNGVNESSMKVIQMLFWSPFRVIEDWINSSSNDEITSFRDGSGSNLLITACSIGRIRVVEALIKKGLFTGSETNTLGETAFDRCLLFGHWKCYDIIRKMAFADVSSFVKKDPYKMFRTCIYNKFYQTASRIVKEKLIVIDDEMVNSSPSHATQWLTAHSNIEIDIETAVIKGIYDIVEDKISKGVTGKLDWKKFERILNKPKIEHVQIFELLLRNKLLDPDQVYEIENPTVDRKEGDDATEITWPLFVACENGDMNMFNLLMNYVSKESISRQNKKGGYCLWIASCNKHIDIVSRLITEGADPNMVNSKGENAIVPACQKSAVSVVELLLVAGARLDLYNRERDNPFLLCCRIGQHVILEMFLQRLSASELDDIHNQYAKIDGFNPLHASTELNRVECIKVCHRYRANLEWRTTETNEIIPGATALHLASFYNNVDSLRVLIELGADVTAITSVGGYNCMHIAVRRGHMRVVGYLMTLSAKVRDSLLQQRDFDGRTPGYYAQISGNEEIYQEYFCNRLTTFMEKLLYAPDDVVKACSDKIVKYGETPGVYEYRNYVDADVGRGSSLLSLATINRANGVENLLLQIGADAKHRDDYGVTPQFWRALIQNTDSSLIDVDTRMMLERVYKIRDMTTQNKVLLGTPSKAPLMLDSGAGGGTLVSTALTPFVKMNDGFNTNVDQTVIKMLQRSGFMEQSLLGFVDKLKSGKNFPDGKECLEYILWDTRLHMIRLVATGENNLNPVQIMALYLYSTNKNIFEQVNKTLTKWDSSASSVWQPFIFTIYQALSKLPAFEGEVYRTVDWKFDPEFYKIGATLSWSTFSICSKEYSSCVDSIMRDKGVVFIVKSKTGRDISRYSKTPVDQDVIFAPGTNFVVTNYYQANQIALGQANIRSTTFKIREKDIQNAVEGRCIIIELQEC